LREALDGCSGVEDCWLYEKSSVKTGQLIEWLERPEWMQYFYGKSVALAFDNPLHWAFAYVFLDGIAKTISLLPADLEIEITRQYFESSGTEIVLHGDDQPFENVIFQSIDFVNINKIFRGQPQPSNSNVTIDLKLKSRWLIPTSGTSGNPKLIMHTLESLSHTVKRKSEKSGNYHWGMLYKLNRFAGVQVFLQSFLSNSTLIFTNDTLSLSNQIDQLVEGKCNALSGTPTMFRKLLMTRNFDKLDLRQITLGGEIVDNQILQSLSKAQPDARVVHIYASTEAGVGFAVTDGQSGFPRNFNGKCVAGIDVKIDNENILWLRNAMIRRENLLEHDEIMNDDGFINTGDVVQLINNRYQFLGRENGAINVGGNKILPEEVEQIIQEITQVEIVAVKGMRSSITGQIIVAEVVASDVADAKALKLDILQHCRDRLPDYKVPSLVRMVDDIELSNAGKLRR